MKAILTDDVARHAHQLARDALGNDLNPAELLIIGDTGRDIQCARAIGARVLAVATGQENIDDLTRHQPDFLVKDLSEITAVELV